MAAPPNVAPFADVLADLARELRRGLSCLVVCDKGWTLPLFVGLKERLRAADVRCGYLDGRVKDAANAEGGVMLAAVAQMRWAARDAEAEGVVFALPHLDIMTAIEGGWTSVSREVIPLLYENHESVWLGFQDPSVTLPPLVEKVFSRRYVISTPYRTLDTVTPTPEAKEEPTDHVHNGVTSQMSSTLLDSGAVRLRDDFFPDHTALYEYLASSVVWDTRIRARKSASFGQPYNYSGIEWPAAPFPEAIATLLGPVGAAVGFAPNNCLANFYPDGGSSMGFHSDSVAELEPGTGIAVLSLGTERTITFRRSDDKAVSESYRLAPGGLLWMCPDMQAEWRHAVLADPGATGGRISLTFRRIKA